MKSQTGEVRRLKGGLPEEILPELRALADLCDKRDGIRLKLNWGMLERRPEGETNDFVWMEGGRAAGFLALYSFNTSEAEVGGMVHPDFRRRGIFGRLLEAAAEEARKRGIPKLLFVCPHDSAGARGFVDKIGARYSFSEYGMQLTEEALAEARKPSPADPGHGLPAGHLQHTASGDPARTRTLPAITLRRADSGDRELMIRLDVEGFNLPEEDSAAIVDMVLGNPESEWAFIASEGGGETVGKINVYSRDDNAHFFGFTVLPEHRGCGYGRAILNEGIRSMAGLGFKSMTLEVSCDNRNALSLYTSCGFRETYVNDYYEWKL